MKPLLIRCRYQGKGGYEQILRASMGTCPQENSKDVDVGDLRIDLTTARERKVTMYRETGSDSDV